MEELSFLETHGNIFIGGKNLGTKHNPRLLKGLDIKWDNDNRWCLLTWNNETGRILEGNCAYMVPGTGNKVPVNQHKTEHVEGRKRAQVSTPMGHVFEGPGKGKTKQ